MTKVQKTTILCMNLLLDENTTSMALTRNELIKVVVADAMVHCESPDYFEKLKKMYHKWEHASSQDLRNEYNKIRNVIYQ